MTNRPNVLIEDWLPFEELGVESQRENSTGLHPPVNRLHVWFARRPLTASRAAILAGILPKWNSDWPTDLLEVFPTEDDYRKWFLHLLGIKGDPVASFKLIRWAKETDTKLKSSPYEGPRAFTVNPQPDNLRLLNRLISYTWNVNDISVMDVTAGGGSIPFESLRYGFTTYANELNPVASLILKATLEYPAIYGTELGADIRGWGQTWIDRVKKRLDAFFPKQNDENIFAYLWARTVACPSTGKPVPLSPNWWLSKRGDLVAVQMITQSHLSTPEFIIKTNEEIDFDPDKGTVSRGVGLSPWTNEAIDGDYIKAEAQAGRMGQILYAIAQKRTGGFSFRAPSEGDLKAVENAEDELHDNYPSWQSKGFVPAEQIDEISNYDRGHRLYGIYQWSEFFSPRQLLSNIICLEVFAELSSQIPNQIQDSERARAVQLYLAMALDKALIYNARQSRFDPSRGIRSIFDKHNFAFLWSHAEFDTANNLLPWVLDQTIDSYTDIAELSSPTQYPIWNELGHNPSEALTISQGSATDLDHIDDGTIHNITFDPPYYDNVMYAELSDFFYVWLKRSVGHLFPEFFNDHLTNKEDEAVANVARFSAMGKKKKKLAEKDYERKMEAIFRECNRVLRDDGVLTIMFTHKKVEAWDTLASALINAGFTVRASWPVHTESEHSLHQAKKNAAASTILLTCRKRIDGGEPVWWEDIRAKVRRIAREKAEEFAAQGIGGVDLYISTFGPALSVISEQWPVLTSEVDEKTGEPLPLRPETALDLAREEVVSLRKQGLLLGRDIEFDAITDWYLMAWDAFSAAEFPYDEARKLAIALGVDLDGDLRGKKNLVTKKSSSVVMQTPKQRRKRGVVDPDVETFDSMVDAVHTALLVLEEDGTHACEVFLNRSGLMGDGAFKQCVQAMINAIPRTKIKKKWARVEAELLERLRLNFFTDLAVPVEEEPPNLPTQLDMFDDGASDEDLEDDDEFDEDEDEE